MARNSLSVARWTLLSRMTGFLRGIVVAAVLGATYLGNTFLATNLLPTLTFELLTGSLIASLLVPALVRHVDARDEKEVARVAGGFLGVALVGFGVIAVLGILAGPLLLALLTATVTDPAVAEAQRHAGLVLIALLMPQVVLYGIAGIGGAVMNAHGRFALAAGASTLENLGVIATMVFYALAVDGADDIRSVTDAQLLILGGGTTASVGLHAGAQWWGARRVCPPLVPRLGWSDPEVRALMKRMVPSLGYSGLNALRGLVGTIAANSVAGGIVALQLAYNFLHLPTAVGARPIALAMLPPLSRLHHRRDAHAFRDEFVRGLGLIAFVAVPTSIFYLTLARPIAEAASFGELATAEGVTLLAAALSGISLGVLGESVFVMATHAAYAQEDARSPFHAMIVRTIVSMAGIAVALTLGADTLVLFALAFTTSLGNLASAWWLVHRLTRGLPPGRRRVRGPVARAALASAAMVAPAHLVVALASRLGLGNAGDLIAMVLAGAAAAATFLAIQRALRSPELAFFLRGFGRQTASGKH